MNPRIQDPRDRVQSWLEALDRVSVAADEPVPPETEGPPAKRARLECEARNSADDDFTHPFNIAEDTPPHTEWTMDQDQSSIEAGVYDKCKSSAVTVACISIMLKMPFLMQYLRTQPRRSIGDLSAYYPR